MKYETFEQSHSVEREGDTADLHRCLWLTRMNPATRKATIGSLARLRDASRCDGELSVGTLRQLIETPDAELRAAIGQRWTQVACDAR